MKIAITGTHGAGKTTLCHLMAAHYKMIGKNVKVIDEVARDCPFPLNENMTLDTAYWIYHQQCLRELESKGKYDIIICDRTRYDSFSYARAKRLRILGINYDYSDYDKIILVKPDLELIGDGTRCVNVEFQKKVSDIFECNFTEDEIISINSSDIFSENEKWKHYCL